MHGVVLLGQSEVLGAGKGAGEDSGVGAGMAAGGLPSSWPFQKYSLRLGWM
jgi:hypothetical protein